mmetsp:Transcript_48731/g.105646  ORF Transcript_48731/g.105646 Transcript_48731/m.105646 type:complete len:208 (-) Transcript_48731:57-680(-)
MFQVEELLFHRCRRLITHLAALNMRILALVQLTSLLGVKSMPDSARVHLSLHEERRGFVLQTRAERTFPTAPAKCRAQRAETTVAVVRQCPLCRRPCTAPAPRPSRARRLLVLSTSHRDPAATASRDTSLQATCTLRTAKRMTNPPISTLLPTLFIIHPPPRLTPMRKASLAHSVRTRAVTRTQSLTKRLPSGMRSPPPTSEAAAVT